MARPLSISERLLRDLNREGDVPVLRLGRRVPVRNTTVQEVLGEARRPPRGLTGMQESAQSAAGSGHAPRKSAR